MQPPILPASSLVNYRETHDFDEQAELLRDWNQDYLQMSSGHFNGNISEIKFDDVHLFLEYTNQALFQHGQLDKEIVAVGVPLSAKNHGVFCGAATHIDSMHVFSGRNGFEFFSPNELVMGGISINRNALLNLLTPEEQQVIDTCCDNAHLCTLDQTGLDTIRSFIKAVFQTLQARPELLQNSQITASIRTTLLGLLADNLIQVTDPISANISSTRCWKIVAESRDLVLSQSDKPISVAELCQHFGISRRTLQYCFQNLLATSPATYLRTERLNAVRHMLKEANSVTEAAAYWGFWHFGHFSQEYKKMFGELPSMTFKRLHALH